MARKKAVSSFEGESAMVSMAGLRAILQANVVVTNATENTYTVQSTQTKRVICIHFATNDNDIRFDYNAAATATDFPVVSGRYFTVDAKKGDVLRFFNNGAGPFTVYFYEVD